MEPTLRARIFDAEGPRALWLVRVMTGGVFVSEGVQKFLFSDALGVGRFAKIGIPWPTFTAPFVGVGEIVCGLMLLVGFATRLGAALLVIDMVVAIATTKLPMLHAKGFWAMAHEARTDWSMLLGCSFLVLVGAGPLSLDGKLSRSRRA